MEEREGESCSRNRRRLENQEYKVRYGKNGVRHMGGMGGWAKKVTGSAFHRGAHCRLGVGESLSKGRRRFHVDGISDVWKSALGEGILKLGF